MKKKKKCHGVSASNDQIGGNVGIPSIDSTTGSVSVELLLLRCGLPMKDPLGVKDNRSASPSRPIPLSSSTEPFDVLVELAERKREKSGSTPGLHRLGTPRVHATMLPRAGVDDSLSISAYRVLSTIHDCAIWNCLTLLASLALCSHTSVKVPL